MTVKNDCPVPTIEHGCIACGSCEFIAPEVFTVTDKSWVNKQADVKKNAELIKKAAAACPVQVIKLSRENL